MKTRLLTALLLSGGALFGADREFDRLVKAVETHYGVKRTHIPAMGFANLVVKIARPAGTAGFHLALFENLDSAPGYGGAADLNRFFDNLPPGKLQPLVRTRTRDGNLTYIYTGDPGKTTRLLIATFEQHQATLIEVWVNFDRLTEIIGNPGSAKGIFGGQDKHGDW